jgi:hypothetical protein
VLLLCCLLCLWLVSFPLVFWHFCGYKKWICRYVQTYFNLQQYRCMVWHPCVCVCVCVSVCAACYSFNVVMCFHKIWYLHWHKILHSFVMHLPCYRRKNYTYEISAFSIQPTIFQKTLHHWYSLQPQNFLQWVTTPLETHQQHCMWLVALFMWFWKDSHYRHVNYLQSMP